MRFGSFALALGVLPLVLLAWFTVHRIAPTEVRGEAAAATEFSAVRARVHVEAIAQVPHPVGSPAHEAVRAYILGVLKGLPVEAHVQEARVAVKAAGVTHAAHVANVIARLPGTQAGPAVLLAAHYDSVPGSRGASDDGSGVATLLETARALAAGPRLRNDVLFVFTDAEESAACGALAFVQEELEGHPVGVALNFEARGTRGAVALYDVSGDAGELVSPLGRLVPRVVSNSLLGSLARTLPNDSDATVWKRAGIPTYAFAYVDGLYQYHQYTDSLAALDLESLQHDGDYALPLTRYFASRELPLAAASPVAYFDVFGCFVVAYSTLVARALGGLTLLGYAFVLRTAVRRTGATLPRTFAGGALAGGALAGLIVLGAAVAAGATHLVLHGLVDSFVFLARPLTGTLAAIVAAVAFVTVAVTLRPRAIGVVDGVLGALGLWAFLLFVTLLFAPGASFALQWPLAFALVGAFVWIPAREQRSARVDALLGLSLVPATFFWSYLAYTLYVMIGGHVPEAVALAVALPLLLATPFLARFSALDLRRAAAVSGTASLLCAVVGGLLIRKSPDLPRPDSLVYSVRVGHSAARWTTNATYRDDFVAKRIPRGHQTARAEPAELAPLETTVHATNEGGVRHTVLHVASPRRARCIGIWETSDEPILRARIDGKDVVALARFSPETDEKIVRFFSFGGHLSPWAMQYCGADEHGFEVELFSAAGHPLAARIIEYADGFPVPALPPRGPTDGYPASDSDLTEAMLDLTL